MEVESSDDGDLSEGPPEPSVWVASLETRQEISAIKDELADLARFRKTLVGSPHQDILATIDRVIQERKDKIIAMKPVADSIKVLTLKLQKHDHHIAKLDVDIANLIEQKKHIMAKRDEVQSQLRPLKQQARLETPVKARTFNIASDDGDGDDYMSGLDVYPPVPETPIPARTRDISNGHVANLKAKFENAKNENGGGREKSRTPHNRTNRFAALATAEATDEEQDRVAEQLLEEQARQAEHAASAAPPAPATEQTATAATASAPASSSNSAAPAVPAAPIRTVPIRPRPKPYDPETHRRQQSQRFEQEFTEWMVQQNTSRARIRHKSAPPRRDG